MTNSRADRNRARGFADAPQPHPTEGVVKPRRGVGLRNTSSNAVLRQPAAAKCIATL
jgi:hypothetical protein